MDIASVIQNRISTFAANAPSSADVEAAISTAVEGIDADRATEADLVSIRESLRDSGVRPSLALAKGLADAGFDPLAVRDAGRDTVIRPRLPGGPLAGASSGRGAQVFDTLKTILADYEGQELTAEDREDIATKLREQLGDGPILSQFA